MAAELIERAELAVDGRPPVVATWRRVRSRRAVLLVHGILGWRRLPEIEDVAERVAAAGLDAVSIDVHGHGDDPGRFTWGREEWRQVDAAVRALREHADEVDVVGFSFGGFHSALAAMHGTPVRRLVLVSAPVDLRVRDVVPLHPGFLRALPLVMRRTRRPARLELPRGLRGRAVRPEDARGIAQPTLVLHGGADWVIGRRHARRWAEWIPGARLVEVPGGLHAEYLVRSHPAEFFGALEPFLEIRSAH